MGVLANMRILFYSNWYIKQTVPVANALATEHEVTVVFPQISPELNAFDGCVKGLTNLLSPGVTLITLPHMQELDPLGFIPVLKTRNLIKRLRPDIVHFNESYDFRCLLLMLLCPGVRFVTSVHDPIPHSGEQVSLKKFKHWVRNQVRRRSQGLVVFGESLREVLANYSRIPIERIHAVPHGEYRYYTYFDQGGKEARKNGHKNILFFGRWEYYKGIDVLVDAEPMITDRMPNARIVLAGEGRLPLSELQCRMIHPENFVIRNYAVPDEEVPDLFREADVVVLPYRQATQSGPLHIAGTFAKPVIVTRVGAMPEVVTDGETGLLISPDNPEELAAAVCRLLENPEEAQRLGENARALMSQGESIEQVAKIQADAYRQVVERNRQTRRSLILSFLQTAVKKIKRDSHHNLDETQGLGDVMSMMWKLGTSLVRGMLYRPFLGQVCGLCFINGHVKLRNCRHIFVGRNFVAEYGCEIQGLAREGIHFGDNVTVGAYSMIRPSGYYGRDIGEGLIVGDRSNIGPLCYLGCYGGITIGSDVMMAPRVSLFAENHDFDRTDVPMRQQSVTRRRIVIEDDCWLASGCVILAGVNVGRGSVVGAGAVVTKDIPPYSIVAGNPARVIRSRKADSATVEV